MAKQNTIAALKGRYNSLIPDNTNLEVSPEDVRDVLDDTVDTVAAGVGFSALRTRFATVISTNPASGDGGQMVFYGSGTPSDTNDLAQNFNFSSVHTIRMSVLQGAYDTNLDAPNVDSDNTNPANVLLYVMSVYQGVTLTFSTNSLGGNNPTFSGKVVGYAGTVTQGTDTSDPSDPVPYYEFSDLIWGRSVTAPDQGSVILNVEIEPGYISVPSLVSGLISSERTRFDEFVDSDGVTELTGYTNIDANTGTFTGANGELILTQGTGSPPPDEIALAFNNSSGTSNRAALEEADEIGVLVGSSFMIVELGSRETQSANSVEVAFKWDVTIDAERGEDVYNTLPAGAAKVYIRRIIPHLREELPTGTDKTDGTLQGTDKFLLGDFDEIEVNEVNEFHDEHHVGTQTLTGFTFTTGGVSNQASDSGKIAWPGGEGDDKYVTINVVNKDTERYSLIAKLTANKKLTVRESSAIFKTGVVENASYSDGLLTVKTDSVDETGTLSDDQAATIEVESNIPSRSQVQAAITEVEGMIPENIPDAPANQSTVKRYVLQVPASSGDPTFEEEASGSNKDWVGTRKELRGATYSDGDWRGMRTTITPSSTTVKIKVRYSVTGAVGTTSNAAENGRQAVLCGRWKVTSGSDWKAFITQTQDYSPLGMRNFDDNVAYIDWNMAEWSNDFEFVPGTTSPITIDLAIRQNDQPVTNNFVTDGRIYYNRAISGSSVDLEGNDDNDNSPPSWVEVSEYKTYSGDAPITTTVITSPQTL